MVKFLISIFSKTQIPLVKNDRNFAHKQRFSIIIDVKTQSWSLKSNRNFPKVQNSSVTNHNQFIFYQKIIEKKFIN